MADIAIMTEQEKVSRESIVKIFDDLTPEGQKAYYYMGVGMGFTCLSKEVEVQEDGRKE